VSLVLAFLAAAGILLWPGHSGWHRLGILPGVGQGRADTSVTSAFVSVRSRPRFASAVQQARQYLPGQQYLPGHPDAGVSAPDLLGLLEAIAPALEAGIAPAAALRIAADARSGSADLDPLAALASDMASAAAQGGPLGPLWRRAAESAGSAELRLLAQAWSLTEDLGVPLAQAVRTASGLLEARIAHERRLAGAVAGAKATVNLLTLLPIGGPLLALVLGIGPAELYGVSPMTQASLVLGLCLAGIGRCWVHRMVRAVARGPVIACGSLP
jgi:tight adherence protein B